LLQRDDFKILRFCAGEAGAWALELTQDLINRGVISEDHVQLQSLGAFVGVIDGQIDMYHVPWSTEYAEWASFCASQAELGTNRSYRLLQGHPLTSHTQASDVNFICPSKKTLESNKRALNYDEGPQNDLMSAFLQMTSATVGMDTDTLRVRTPTSVVHLMFLAFDSTNLTRGAFQHKDRVFGVSPPLSVTDCKALWDADDRDQRLKQIPMVTGVDEFVAVGAGDPSIRLDVGRFFSSDDTKRDGQRSATQTTTMAQDAERCASCRTLEVACVAACLACQKPDAKGNRAVCPPCRELGFQDWSPLRRVSNISFSR
jgi:hypothetical protein